MMVQMIFLQKNIYIYIYQTQTKKRTPVPRKHVLIKLTGFYLPLTINKFLCLFVETRNMFCAPMVDLRSSWREGSHRRIIARWLSFDRLQTEGSRWGGGPSWEVGEAMARGGAKRRRDKSCFQNKWNHLFLELSTTLQFVSISWNICSHGLWLSYQFLDFFVNKTKVRIHKLYQT